MIADANAQQNPYDVSLISKDLLPYASAVVRDEQSGIEVKDLDNVIYHYKTIVTILNKNGDEQAHLQVNYDKNSNIKYIKGIIYNSFGIQIRKISESDFEDVATTDGFSLFQDSRAKIYEPAVTDYPYTIEYEYEVRAKQTLTFPDWTPDPELGIAVEKSSFTFTCKPDFTIRYKELNMPSGADISTNKDGLKTYTWQVSNLKAVKDEPYNANPDNYLSSVKIAPVTFKDEGFTGSFTNWNELGKWIYDKLLINRQDISPETAQYITQLTAGITDPKLKAKKIYEYMQGKTHYVSVQVGIGGYQPFPAADVDKLNYGDCKALVNYTRALLKVVGIESYYCVVMADDERKISLLSDFASMTQANHIILCIPFKNDTTWSDCTSQTIPFGYLGDFTDDRTVLACTPQGGKLMHTPKYTTEANLQLRKADFTINTDGELSGGMTTIFKGTQYINREGTIDESPTERVKTMHNIYAINNLNIEKLEFKQDKGSQPVTTENIQLKAPEYASVSDGKIYFLPNIANRMYNIPRQVHNRVTDVYINEGYTDEDEVTYTLPPGYHQDSSPLNVRIRKPFGTFTATTQLVGNQLIYHRKLEFIDGTYPKDDYQELVDFYQDIYDNDGHDVILVKN